MDGRGGGRWVLGVGCSIFGMECEAPRCCRPPPTPNTEHPTPNTFPLLLRLDLARRRPVPDGGAHLAPIAPAIDGNGNRCSHAGVLNRPPQVVHSGDLDAVEHDNRVTCLEPGGGGRAVRQGRLDPDSLLSGNVELVGDRLVELEHLDTQPWMAYRTVGD